MTVNFPPTDDDAGLLALEVRFDDLVTELLGAQNLTGAPRGRPGRLEISSGCGIDCEADPEVVTEQVESVLARLHPIEQAIMQTPARTIAGLAVKARHAAYVMSEYWNAPIDRMDWDSRAVRLLIEAVCESAGISPPFRKSAGDATPR
jgi:hypothetical protein